MTQTTYAVITAGSGQVSQDEAVHSSGGLLEVAARARTQIRSCCICGEQSGNGADFLRVLRFSLPILIPPTAPQSSSYIIRGWCNRPNSGQRAKWTHPHPTSRNKKKS
jgi:hypothetical protein